MTFLFTACLHVKSGKAADITNTLQQMFDPNQHLVLGHSRIKVEQRPDHDLVTVTAILTPLANFGSRLLDKLRQAAADSAQPRWLPLLSVAMVTNDPEQAKAILAYWQNPT